MRVSQAGSTAPMEFGEAATGRSGSAPLTFAFFGPEIAPHHDHKARSHVPTISPPRLVADTRTSPERAAFRFCTLHYGTGYECRASSILGPTRFDIGAQHGDHACLIASALEP